MYIHLFPKIVFKFFCVFKLDKSFAVSLNNAVAPFPFFFRLNSYKCITDTLQELVNQSKAAPQSPSVPKKPGPPVLSSDPNMLSNEEAGHHVRDIAYFYSEITLFSSV